MKLNWRKSEAQAFRAGTCAWISTNKAQVSLLLAGGKLLITHLWRLCSIVLKYPRADARGC